MVLRIYIVIVIFCVTALLIFTAYLRGINNRIFYRFYQCRLVENRLKQQLGNKQIQVEGLINPASVWKSLDRSGQQ